MARIALAAFFVSLLAACGSDPAVAPNGPSTNGPGARSAAASASAAASDLPVVASDAPLPPGAVTRLGTTRFRQADEIKGMAFLPDGRIATAGRDLRVLVFDPKTGLPTHELKGPRWVADSVAVSPDGSIVAAGDRDEIFLWELPSGELRHRIKGKFNYARAMAFSPDGKLLAAAADDEWSSDTDETLCLYDVALGKRVHAFEGHKRYGHAVAFSPDGKRLASANERGELRLWDVEARREIAELEGHERRVSAVAFSPDGRTLVSAGGDPALLSWDALTGKAKGTLRPKVWGEQIAFSPDGRTLYVGSSDDIDVVDTTAAEGSTVLVEKKGKPFALSRDGKVIAVTEEKQEVSLWRIADKTRLSPESKAPRAAIKRVSFSEGGDKVTVLSEKWELATFSARDGKLQSASSVPERTGLSSRGATCAWPDTGYENRVYRVACSESGAMVAGSRSGALVVGGTPSSLEIKLKEHETPDCMSFSPDDKRLAAGTSDGNLLVVDLTTGKTAFNVEATRWGVDICAFSPDGKLIVTAAGWDDPLTFWDASTGKKVKDFGLFKYPLEAAAFSPDGKALAVAYSRGIGRRVVEGETWVRVFDVASGKVLKSFDGHASSVYALAFSPDGRMLATGSQDTTVLLWDMRDLSKP